MQGELVRVDPGRQCNGELTARGDVDAQTFLDSQSSHCPAQKRLACVDDVAGTERSDGLTTAVAQMLLVVHEHRCSELGREVEGTHPTDSQLAVDNGCGVGK